MSDLEGSISAEEARLRAEKDSAYTLVLKKPTIANRKAYGQAEKALADFLRALSEPLEIESFTGVADVLEYLQSDGWKIGKSKLYDDFAAGLLKAAADGSISLESAMDYARINLKKLDGTPGTGAALPSLQEQKILEEVGRIRADRKQRELKYKEATGELIRRSEVEIEFAKRINYLRSDLKNIFRAGAVEIIRLVGGDPQKAAILIAYGICMVDAAMDRYGRTVRLGSDDE